MVVILQVRFHLFGNSYSRHQIGFKIIKYIFVVDFFYSELFKDCLKINIYDVQIPSERRPVLL